MIFRIFNRYWIIRTFVLVGGKAKQYDILWTVIENNSQYL